MTIGSKFTTPPVGVTRYVKHPPASDWTDGYPVDAETSMLIHNNLSVLCERKCRLLGFRHVGWVDSYSFASKGNSPYSGIIEEQMPDTITAYNRIPWTINDSVRIGPIPGVAVALSVSPPGYILRSIRVVVEYTLTGGTAGKYLYLAAAVTNGATRPNAELSSIARASTSIAADGASGRWDTTLTFLTPLRTSDHWLALTSSAQEAENAVIPLFVWVGFTTDNTAAVACAVRAVSVFEVYQ